jgi:hypothetical protein
MNGYRGCRFCKSQGLTETVKHGWTFAAILFLAFFFLYTTGRNKFLMVILGFQLVYFESRR